LGASVGNFGGIVNPQTWAKDEGINRNWDSIYEPFPTPVYF